VQRLSGVDGVTDCLASVVGNSVQFSRQWTMPRGGSTSGGGGFRANVGYYLARVTITGLKSSGSARRGGGGMQAKESLDPSCHLMRRGREEKRERE
jgi:hypothetical protein